MYFFFLILHFPLFHFLSLFYDLCILPPHWKHELSSPMQYSREEGMGLWCSNSLHKAVSQRIWNGDCQNRKQPSQRPPAWILKMSPHRARDGEKPSVPAWNPTEDALEEWAERLPALMPLWSESWALPSADIGVVLFFTDWGKNSANQVKNYNPLLSDTSISMENFIWNVIPLRKSILQEVFNPQCFGVTSTASCWLPSYSS